MRMPSARAFLCGKPYPKSHTESEVVKPRLPQDHRVDDWHCLSLQDDTNLQLTVGIASVEFGPESAEIRPISTMNRPKFSGHWAMMAESGA